MKSEFKALAERNESLIQELTGMFKGMEYSRKSVLKSALNSLNRIKAKGRDIR